MNLRQGRKEAVTVLDGTKYGNLQLRSREAGMSRPNLVLRPLLIDSDVTVSTRLVFCDLRLKFKKCSVLEICEDFANFDATMR